MADIKTLIREYLKNARVLQLATSVDNKPWACNVHFYSDDDLNLYWISNLERRHSQDIKQNPNAAITIKVHEDTLEEHYIIGLSAEGKATLATMEDAKRISELYRKKLDKDPKTVEDALTETSQNKFYRLTPIKFIVFDTKTFSEHPRQEITL
jgi:uncharacterized protein YhbP (UPF0306 family)